MTITDALRNRREHAINSRHAAEIEWAWRAACEGSGLGVEIETALGTSVAVPHLVEITLGPPTVLLVQLLPGQLAGDVRRAGPRLAPTLGAVALRVESHGLRYARVELLTVDPLAGLLPLRLPRSRPGLLLGIGEDGQGVIEDLDAMAHTVVQGVTRTGKSMLTYGLLAQLASNPHVRIAGCDPTGLLWRPFAGSRHEPWQTSGTGDAEAHIALLARLVAEMDQRIADLPDDRDTLLVDEHNPYVVVVLEELVGLLRVADAAKTKTDNPGARFRALLARLLAEGAKVGYRLVLLVQRAEAQLMGAFERAMCSTAISFRCDKPSSIELLHTGVDPAVAAAHTVALPGIALLSAPGRPLQRIRAPYLPGGYREYSAAVRTACLPLSTT